ncbi:replication protein [Moraxella caprae]|uniref:Replication protein n=1 Tax=Moraxella caprae TaxID=90240 RepID=A0A378U6K5_9GAMM|nr:RepB family plasmid replication initiator protein [Moraxella caprae]STZ70244.1 replication protein [Moraxella caprae]
MIILDNPYFEDVMKDEDWKRVVIWFSPQVIPFLMNLTENFTKYKLSEIAEFSSSYSFRIYEFMMQFQSTGYIKISIKDLRERLQLGDKYPASKDLKLWVIETAVKEINEKSPYKVDYNLIKTGKKFTHLELRFKQKEKPKSLEQKDPNTIDIFDNLTDKEREIVAQKNAYADQIGATAEHRENLIRQGLTTHRQAEQDEQERKQREKAERQVQEQQDKERLALAQRQFEQILASDELINAYLTHNRLSEKNFFGLQKVYYQQGDFRGAFEMERYKFEELHSLKYLNLNFLNK